MNKKCWNGLLAKAAKWSSLDIWQSNISLIKPVKHSAVAFGGSFRLLMYFEHCFHICIFFHRQQQVTGASSAFPYTFSCLIWYDISFNRLLKGYQPCSGTVNMPLSLNTAKNGWEFIACVSMVFTSNLQYKHWRKKLEFDLWKRATVVWHKSGNPSRYIIQHLPIFILNILYMLTVWFSLRVTSKMKSDDLGSTLHKSICMLMLHDTMSALLNDSALLSRHKHLWVKCHVCLYQFWHHSKTNMLLNTFKTLNINIYFNKL